MELFDSEMFIIVKKSLTVLGLWIDQEFWQTVLLKSLAYLVIISTLYFQSSFVISNWNRDMDSVLDCCSIMIVFFWGLGVFSVYSFRPKTIFAIVKGIEDNWKLWASKGELNRLTEHTDVGRTFSTLLFQYNYCALFAYVLMNCSPVLLNYIVPSNETRKMHPVYIAKLPFDEDKYQLGVIIFGAVTCFCMVTILCTVDSLYIMSVQQACGLFAIIRHRMKNISRKFNYSCSKDLLGIEHFYKELHASIMYHNYALRYVKDLENLFSPFLFITYGCNVLTTSFALLQTTMSLGNTFFVVKQIVLSFTALAHIYFLGIPAQNLINESAAVTFDMYDNEWYALPVKIQKLLLFVIVHSNMPCHLTAGKITIMNMESVGKFLKMAFSYFTILSAVSQYSMYAVIILHACGLLEIFRYQIKTSVNTFLSSGKNINIKEFQKKFFFSIKLQLYAIRYANALEDFYSPYLFFTMGINVLTISLPLVQSSISSGNNYISQMNQFLLGFGSLVHIFSIGIPAQNLISVSSSISFDVYSNKWYELPIKYRKLMPFIIMQSDIPCQLTAGGIIVMNMETVAKASISMESNISMVKQVVLSLATMVHVCFLGLPAQNLINESAAFAFDMYDIPVKMQKLVLFIIMHSNIPCQLTAGKISIMNMETVASIIKMAFSYFTMLSAISQ
ncbi:uncharacterized protein LOC122506946 [Leptopilina heterotoma]|uniref:uncharacterized protein LOC122506946 n=1 Tax=Leptopilina heterotoma TaxID=63436 RepID=UPI001CA95043|nr:uncharacterized protein LOC122506946 [Leptopilina heterotoma]